MTTIPTNPVIWPFQKFQSQFCSFIVFTTPPYRNIGCNIWLGCIWIWYRNSVYHNNLLYNLENEAFVINSNIEKNPKINKCLKNKENDRWISGRHRFRFSFPLLPDGKSFTIFNMWWNRLLFENRCLINLDTIWHLRI